MEPLKKTTYLSPETESVAIQAQVIMVLSPDPTGDPSFEGFNSEQTW